MEQELLNELAKYQPKLKKKDFEELREIELGYLIIAVYLEDRNDLLTRLIQEGVDVNTRGYTNDTVLQYAVSRGDLDTTRMLVEAGANPFHLDEGLITIVDYLFFGKAEIPKELCDYILELGVNPYNCKIKDDNLSRPLIEGGEVTLLDLKQWSSFTERDDDYQSAILNKDFHTALEILVRLTNNLGTLHKTAYSREIEALLIDSLFMLHFTGRNEEAETLGAFLNENMKLNQELRLDNCWKLAVFALFKGDSKNFTRFIRNIQRNERSNSIIASTYVLEYLFINRTGGQPNRLERFKEKVSAEFDSFNPIYSISDVVQLILHNRDVERERIEKILLGKILNSKMHIKVTNLFLIYLISNEEYDNARYFEMISLQMDKEEFRLEDFFLHLLLSDYLRELEMSAV